VGPDQFPLLSKIRDQMQKEGQGWERSGDLSQKVQRTDRKLAGFLPRGLSNAAREAN
jgi:hypothetical protein